MSNIIDTLHPKGSLTDNLYPNILKENIPDGSIDSNKLGPNAVTDDKIALYAVSTPQLDDGAVIDSKLGTGAVITAKIANKAVTTAKLDDSAVTTVKLASEAITTAKIANNAVGYNQLSQQVQDNVAFRTYRMIGDVTFKIGVTSYTQKVSQQFALPKSIINIDSSQSLTRAILETIAVAFDEDEFDVHLALTNTSGVANLISIYYDEDSETLNVRLLDGSTGSLESVSGNLYVKTIIS